MDSKSLALLLTVVSLYLVHHVTAQPELIPGPPVRPEIFSSPGELKEYLQALNEYFAIVGRPRFGRSVNRRSTAFRRNSQSVVGSE